MTFMYRSLQREVVIMQASIIKQMLQLTLVRVKEYYRNPGLVFLTLFFPSLLLIVLGFAYSPSNNMQYHVAVVKNAAKSIHDFEPLISNDHVITLEKSEDSLKFRIANNRLGDIDYNMRWVDSVQAMILLAAGRVDFVLYEQDGQLHYKLDPAVEQSKIAYWLFLSALKSSVVYSDIQRLETLDNITMRYVDFLLPGLIAVIVMNTFLWGVGFTLADMRSRKLLRRMIVSPMNKTAFFISFYFARCLMGALEIAVVCGIAMMFFGFVIKGSIGSFLLVFLIGGLSFWGISILLMSKVMEVKSANLMINVFSLILMLVSGIFYDYHDLPQQFQWLVQWLPLTVFAESLRVVMNGTAVFSATVMPLLSMLIVGFLCYLFGYRMFKWH